MASSSSTQPPAEETRNWLELPRDVTAMILYKLGVIEILTSAQKVCMTWRKICKDPAMWRTIHLYNFRVGEIYYDLEKMARHAIDRSCGQLVDIKFQFFGTDELLQYIIERTSQLRRLRLIYCHHISCDGLSEAAKGLPLLEELHMYFCTNVSEEAFEAVGRCCPLLKSFSFNINGRRSTNIEIEFDDEALVIAGNMPELCHLQLFGNMMTNVGLQAILDGCPHLEALDLRQCFNVNLKGDLAKRLHKIKDLRLPHDSTEDYEFDDQIYDQDDPFSFDDYGDSYQDNDLDYDSDFDYYDDYTKVPGQWRQSRY